MAKPKIKTGANVPHKALHSRISYLYQAAAYLSTQAQHSVPPPQNETTTPNIRQETQPNASAINRVSDATSPVKKSLSASNALSRKMISDLKTVSLKIQVRLSPAFKHSMCKRCDALLIEGSTCTTEIENKSKGRKKPWADIMVRKCTNCGCKKRYPINTDRQQRRPFRIDKGAGGG